MADGQEQLTEQPDFGAVAKAIVAEIVDTAVIEKIWKGQEPVLIRLVEITLGLVFGLAGTLGAELARGIVAGEDIADPAFRRLASVALKDITGIDVDVAPGGGGRGNRAGAARSIGTGIMQALTGIGGGGGGGTSAIEPSVKPAEDYLSFVVQMSLEGWLTGLMGEFASMGQVEALGDLDDSLSRALGLQRTSRAVMRPFINATVATPAEWQINKTYRPELLSTGVAIQQFLRGNWTREQLDEELARQGYSSERIEALINGQRKFFSAGDVRTFVDRDHWTRDQGLQHLRDQGYDQEAAIAALRLEGFRRDSQLENAEAAAIIDAYADHRISNTEMHAMLNVAVRNSDERAMLEELANVRTVLKIKHLSPAEARAAVKAGILGFRDYQTALEREGYTPEAVDVLDLLLRIEIAKDRNVQELRAEQAAERAAEKQARAAAAAARRAEVDADRARRRRGPIGDLERAAVRGLIPFERVQEVLAVDYDPDTVAILLSLVEDDRQRYLAQQAAAEEARKRNPTRDLDVGTLERAVMAGLLTPEEFQARLDMLHFAPADAALLAAVVRAKKDDQDVAIARRREAEQRASKQRIDLSRFERLVRRGARSMAEYDALLQQLGFEDADRAAMRTLLEIQIADDRQADAEREAARKRLEPRGLSLEQIRRAVILGTRTEDDFQRFLVEQNFTADAQAVLLADLRLAVTEADDARRRRAQEAPAPGARGLSLSTLQRAARLGIISPATYQARLEALGYSGDDLAIELELLLTEIAETQAARQQRDTAEAEAGERGLTLAQVDRGVRAGALTLDDYRAAAIGAGLSRDAIDVIVAVLAQEVGTLTEAREVRTRVLRELADQNVSLEELEKGVTKSGRPVAAFVDELEQRGVGADEAELVASLLLDQMEA